MQDNCAGDESAVPATFAMLEALPDTATATVILEIFDPSSERPLPAAAATAPVQWVGLGDIPGVIAAIDLPVGSPATVVEYVSYNSTFSPTVSASPVTSVEYVSYSSIFSTTVAELRFGRRALAPCSPTYTRGGRSSSLMAATVGQAGTAGASFRGKWCPEGSLSLPQRRRRPCSRDSRVPISPSTT